ncbi:MAG: sigma-54 dependent transcriptional regulator [Dissulfurispiraceae bacterium]
MRSKILVIDDEESIRFAFDNILSDAGYEVTTAATYDEALTCVTKADFDLIFADIILGNRSGIDILRKIREKDITCPVIIITGVPDIDSASEAVRLGAFDYIPKPIRLDVILKAAQTALQFKALTLEKEKYRYNLDAIFRSVRDAIITVDTDLTVIEVNEAATAICGHSRDIVGRTFTPSQSGCDGKCLEVIKRTIETGQPLEIHHFECRHKERPHQVVNLNSYPLVYQQGKVSGVVLVARDETRLTNLERDLHERFQMDNIIGKSEDMQKIYTLIESLSGVEATVLLTGESGTGKGLVAETVHYRGPRCEKPFVKVNCTALSDDLLESELFGHIKGAFTGAIRDEIGRFKRADGGTIFLDEIGDISSRMQLRLLGVLQKMEFERVGDSTPIKVDVRVIAATNADLREKVRLGRFREDLYYRLKVVELHLPPLRERKEDITALIPHFLNKLNKKLGKQIIDVSSEVLRLFMTYQWPGNVRELEHVMEHAFVVSRQPVITINDLPADLIHSTGLNKIAFETPLKDDPQSIIQVLERTAWNKSKAANILGLSRSTIYRRIAEYKIKEH